MIFLIFIISLIYIFITWKNSKEKKISPWLEGNIQIRDDKFFKYQFRGSIIIFILIMSIAICFKKYNINNIYSLLIVLIFWILNFLVKYTALKKGYIFKKK